MHDREVPVTSAVAVVLWLVGTILILVDLALPVETGELGLLAAGAAGVLNIRGFLQRQRERELEAFLSGRESHHVTPLRR